MKKLSKQELLNIDGGINITSTLLNSIARLGGVILDFGRTIGTIIVRLRTGQICRF